MTKQPQYVTDENGTRVAVILDSAIYEQMLRELGRLNALVNSGTGTDVLPTSAAARLLGISRPTLYRLHADGYLGQEIDGHFIFTREEVMAYKAYRERFPSPLPTGRPPKTPRATAQLRTTREQDLERWRAWRTINIKA